jgi:hypothetical protein
MNPAPKLLVPSAPMGRAALLALALLAAAPAQAIIGGTATTAFMHVSNGVQITDNWVLTARHVGSLSVNMLYSNGWGQATIAARYELGGGAFPANDLALLRLATPIAAAPALGLLATELLPGVLATPLAATIATGRNQLPRGFAVTGITEVVDAIDPDGDLPLLPVPVSYLISTNGSGQPPIVQGGDSGGGLFLGAVSDSSGALLMGISSAQLQDDARTPIGSAFVQLASHRSWIDDTMAADLVDSQLALWLPSAVPEPATWALLLAGAAALAARRRRPADQGTSLP